MAASEVNELGRLLDWARSFGFLDDCQESCGKVTPACILLVFAVGFSKLGAIDEASVLLEEASSSLDLSDTLEKWILTAYEFQVNSDLLLLPEAIQVRGEESIGMLNLRGKSTLLEPLAFTNPLFLFADYCSRDRLELGDRVSPLARMVTALESAVQTEPASLQREHIATWLELWTQLGQQDRSARLTDFVSVLDRFEPGEQLHVLQWLVPVAAHLSHSTTPELSERLCRLLEANVDNRLHALGSATLPALRFSGQHPQVVEVVGRLEPTASIPLIRARILCCAPILDRADEVEPTLAEFHHWLDLPVDGVDEKLRILRALAIASSDLEPSQRHQHLIRLGDDIRHIPNLPLSSSHAFSLLHINALESLVLAHLSEVVDLGLHASWS